MRVSCVDWMIRCGVVVLCLFVFFFFQAEDGIRDLVRSRGLGDVYKRQSLPPGELSACVTANTTTGSAAMSSRRPIARTAPALREETRSFASAEATRAPEIVRRSVSTAPSARAHHTERHSGRRAASDTHHPTSHRVGPPSPVLITLPAALSAGRAGNRTKSFGPRGFRF